RANEPGLLDRPVDGPAPASAHRGGVRRPLQPRLPDALAAAARLHTATASPRPARARRARDRPVAGGGLATHQAQRQTPGGVSGAAGRERPADGPAATAQLDVARLSAGAEGEGRPP